MEREEKDTKLKKNEVFRRNKKCITQENHNNNHHHSDNGPTPCKMLKLESSSSTESDTENTNNKTFSVSNYFNLLIFFHIDFHFLLYVHIILSNMVNIT